MHASLPQTGRASRKARHFTPRSGFTLIELLIVVAIILILAGLVLKVTGSVIANAKAAKTKQRLKVVQDLLAQRLDGFTQYFNNTENLKKQAEYLEAMSEANNDADLAAILAKKKLMRRFFPQSLSEITSISAGPSHTAATESSAVLYYILTKGTELGQPTLSAGAFDADALRDTDGDGLLEIVDGWEKPIRFYRWPTRLVKTNGTAVDTTYLTILSRSIPPTAQLSIDPDDPKGKVAAISSFESRYHTPATFHQLLIVSAGEDGALGLYEPSDQTNFGYLAAPNGTAAADVADNYTNLNVIAGGN